MKFLSARIPVSILPLSFSLFPVLSYQVQWISSPKLHCKSIYFFLFIMPPSQSSSGISLQEYETACYLVCLRPLLALIMLLIYLKLFSDLLLLLRKSPVSSVLPTRSCMILTALFTSSYMPSFFQSLIMLFPLLKRPLLLYLSPNNPWISFSAELKSEPQCELFTNDQTKRSTRNFPYAAIITIVNQYIIMQNLSASLKSNLLGDKGYIALFRVMFPPPNTPTL